MSVCEPRCLQNLKLLNHHMHMQGLHFIRLWRSLSDNDSLYLFFDDKLLSFSAIIEGFEGTQLVIPSHTKEGHETIKAPFLSCQRMRNRLASLEPSQLIEFLNQNIQYPILRKSGGYYTIQLTLGGLLGGGCGGSTNRVIPVVALSPIIKVEHNPERRADVREFLRSYYLITAEGIKKMQDGQFLDKFTERILDVIPPSLTVNIEKQMSDFIEIYEDEFFEEIALEILEERSRATAKVEETSKKGEGVKRNEDAKFFKPEFADFAENFHSSNLCIALLRKSYFSKERARGGASKMISEAIIGKLTEQIKKCPKKKRAFMT